MNLPQTGDIPEYGILTIPNLSAIISLPPSTASPALQRRCFLLGMADQSAPCYQVYDEEMHDD